MKKYCLSFILFLLSLASWAYDFEVDSVGYKVISVADRTVEFAGFNNKIYSEIYEIPERVKYEDKVFEVIKIGESAFSYKKIVTAIIPSTVTTIGKNAFISSNIEYIDLPHSISRIEVNAFKNCKSLKHIEVPEKTVCREGVFAGCSSLEEVHLPDDMESIYAGTFESCVSLKEIKLPENLKYMPEISHYVGDRSEFHGAFYGCTGLTKIVLPNSLQYIPPRCFVGCSNLETIDIGENVGNIGSDYSSVWTYYNGESFAGCNNIKNIVCRKPTPPYIPIGDGKKYYDCFSDQLDKKLVKIYVPKESIELYQKANVWKEFWNYYPLEDYDNDDNKEQKGKCQNPIIELLEGKLVFSTITESAKCKVTISTDDVKSVILDESNMIELCGIYKVSAYAYLDGFEDSEITTATLVWVNPTLKDNESANILNMDAKKAVLLKSDGNSITISGTENNEIIMLYTADGQLQDTVVANGYETAIGNGLTKNNLYIVKIGEKSIKYKF